MALWISGLSTMRSLVRLLLHLCPWSRHFIYNAQSLREDSRPLIGPLLAYKQLVFLVARLNKPKSQIQIVVLFVLSVSSFNGIYCTYLLIWELNICHRYCVIQFPNIGFPCSV